MSTANTSQEPSQEGQPTASLIPGANVGDNPAQAEESRPAVAAAEQSGKQEPSGSSANAPAASAQEEQQAPGATAVNVSEGEPSANAPHETAKSEQPTIEAEPQAPIEVDQDVRQFVGSIYVHH